MWTLVLVLLAGVASATTLDTLCADRPTCANCTLDTPVALCTFARDAGAVLCGAVQSNALVLRLEDARGELRGELHVAGTIDLRDGALWRSASLGAVDTSPLTHTLRLETDVPFTDAWIAERLPTLCAGRVAAGTWHAGECMPVTALTRSELDGYRKSEHTLSFCFSAFVMLVVGVVTPLGLVFFLFVISCLECVDVCHEQSPKKQPKTHVLPFGYALAYVTVFELVMAAVHGVDAHLAVYHAIDPQIRTFLGTVVVVISLLCMCFVYSTADTFARGRPRQAVLLLAAVYGWSMWATISMCVRVACLVVSATVAPWQTALVAGLYVVGLVHTVCVYAFETQKLVIGALQSALLAAVTALPHTLRDVGLNGVVQWFASALAVFTVDLFLRSVHDD